MGTVADVNEDDEGNGVVLSPHVVSGVPHHDLSRAGHT